MTGDTRGGGGPQAAWKLKEKHSILSEFYGIMDSLEDLSMDASGLASDALFTMIDELQRLSQKSWVRLPAKVVELKATPSP